MSAKFKIGQVVHVRFVLSADVYGEILGFDNGRWHVKIRENEHKVPEANLRALTRKERGQR